jgi:hypothetical protein
MAARPSPAELIILTVAVARAIAGITRLATGVSTTLRRKE